MSAVLILLTGLFGVMGLFYFSRYKINVKDNLTVSNILREFQAFKLDLENLEGHYIANSEVVLFREKYKKLWEDVSDLSYKLVNKYSDIKFFKDTFGDFDKWVESYNKFFVDKELAVMKPFFSDIDNKALDRQQSIAVVTNEDNTLVLAGAGSGKTLTISAKVKYLVERLGVNPDEILLISFTKKSAEEMTERIQEKLGISIKALTFHKLGLNIITLNDKSRPDIQDDLSEIINKYFSETALKDSNVIGNIVRFYGGYLAVPKDLEEFDTLGEYHQDQSTLDLETLRSKVLSIETDLKNDHRTLKMERVRSLEEVMIANFLYLNGVNYEYEMRYPYPTDKYKKSYRPDFYLPDYDIYIEHFGITRDYRTPWLSSIEEKKYVDDIYWKRSIHDRYGTRLLETYSYFNKEGVLLKELKSMLIRNKVSLISIDLRAVYETLIINRKEEQQFKEFKKLIATFITLFKSNGYNEDDFIRLNQDLTTIKNSFLKERTELFLSIVKPIYEEYQKTLQVENAIDFNDMINNATDIVNNNRPAFLKYKYIIIDEFQDISMGRFRLLKAIKDLTNAKVMAVGDDWQSIYRFAGSDLQVFVDFEKYFGFTKTLRIEKTYRNSQQLIDTAAKFVLKNPIQLKKNLSSDKRLEWPIKIYGFSQDVVMALEKAIEDIVINFGRNAKIMIIGRNNMDLKFLMDRDIYKKFSFSDKNGSVKLKYNRYPNVIFEYNTVHRSKGLEADNVIIINMRNYLIGFPNKISDDPLLSLVLTNADQFMYAEERRLFYVALTRTRNATYLISPEYETSLFVEELIKDYGVHFDLVTNEKSIRQNPKCNVCKTGVLMIRKNTSDNRMFLGCSNYPSCSQTYKEIDILENPIKCPKCGGYMLKRKSSNGEFYGCSNYPLCRNSIDIVKTTPTYNR